MKKPYLMLAMALIFLLISACASNHPAGEQPLDPNAPQPALQTGKATPPPPGCVELRKRGGAC